MKAQIKRYISASVVERVRDQFLKFNRLIVSVCGRSAYLSRLYYLISSAFDNEHIAVLHGRKAYYDSLRNIGKTCALLRRNIHRLEKGLIMRPRRPVFAEKFIMETIDCYKRAVVSGNLDSSERKWASDVLSEYFSVVGSTSRIDDARALYESISFYSDSPGPAPSIGNLNQVLFKPYPQSQLPKLDVKYESLHQLYLRRRSVRWFQDRCVSYDLIRMAANSASYAPSACNRQPYRFIFCGDKNRAVEISKCAGGTAGFAENLPSIVIVIGDLSAYPFERDRHLIYIDSSLAAMQFMLALETLGLSSCSINWPDVTSSEERLRRIVNLKIYERVVMLIAVGYADEEGGIPYSQKKSNNLVLEDISS